MLNDTHAVILFAAVSLASPARARAGGGAGAITRMCVTCDDALLVTGGEDGAVFMMTLHDLLFDQRPVARPVDVSVRHGSRARLM